MKNAARKPNLVGFDEFVERRIAAKEMTCASYTVCIDGEVVCQNALGLADISADRPLGEDTVMRLASMTKPVTGVAVMRARELGLLDLDDEVSRFIPAFAHMRVAEFDGDGNVVGSHPAATPITIRMLLNHSSGLGAGKVKCRAISEAGEGSTLASIVPHYAETPLDFEPLSATGYARTNRSLTQQPRRVFQWIQHPSSNTVQPHRSSTRQRRTSGILHRGASTTESRRLRSPM